MAEVRTPERKDPDQVSENSSSPLLSPDAPAFVPSGGGKKAKKIRAGPRKRRRNKKSESDYLDFDTSDLLERSSQGSNNSSTPGGHGGRRNRERGDKSYVPLYHYGLSPQEGSKYADLTNKNLSVLQQDSFGSDWLMGLVGGEGPRRFRSSSNASDMTYRSSEWLDMQAEWSLSKQLFGSINTPSPNVRSTGLGGSSSLTNNTSADNFTSRDNSHIAIPSNGSAHEEALERKRWSDWAICAAEMERVRRILALEEIDRAEAKERLYRQQMAINMIEIERNERLSENFLTNLSSTNWFHETISSQHNRNYDVVCPYYKLGCRVTCKKSDIEQHVKTCTFGLESSQNSNSEVLDEDYEVVCPNSILGCNYIGSKNDLQMHLNDGCAYKGKTKQEEQEERHMMQQTVINYCEEERVRRLAEEKPNKSWKNKPSSPELSDDSMSDKNTKHLQESHMTSSGGSKSAEVVEDDMSDSNYKDNDGTSTLHLLMEKQMNYVVTGLHNEALQYWDHWREKQSHIRPLEAVLIQDLQCCMKKLWSFASLEPFGSWATGLPGVRSDIDLVVCFEDGVLLTKTPTSRNDLLRKLANFLEIHAKSLITITKVLLHTRVPLIKARTQIAIPNMKSESGSDLVTVELDISIDGPEHSGLATTSLTQSMLRALPGLGPATMLIKEYLKSRDLCDVYTGGLASYATFLLVALLFLRRYHANQLVVEDMSVDENSDDEFFSPVSRKDNNVSLKPTVNDFKSNAKPPSHRPRTLDKNFSSEILIISETSSHDNNDITRSDKTTSVEKTSLSRTGSNDTTYAFTNVKQQIEYGRRVAAKLLLNYSDFEDKDKNLLDLEAAISSFVNSEEFNTDAYTALEPQQPLKSPILGVILVEFLGVYGEELQCGRHGFSMRDGGFRFDVLAGPYTVAHPQANDPLLVEDPVNVMNNVAKKCFNAQGVQKVFLEAHDKLKNVVTRYSGRAGSALSLTGGSVIDEVFGLSLSRLPNITVHSSEGCPTSPLQELDDSIQREYFNSEEVLLHRKHNPTNSTDNEVATRASEVNLGLEFQKVLREMLLNQQLSIECDQELLKSLHNSNHSSPGRSKNSKRATPANSCGIASPTTSKKKSPSKINSSSSATSSCLIFDGCSSNSTNRPPAKKRSSYTATRQRSNNNNNKNKERSESF